MTSLSLIPINQQVAADSGHHFDTRRHWAAFLTLGFSSFAEGEITITRMNTAGHYGPLRVQHPFDLEHFEIG